MSISKRERERAEALQIVFLEGREGMEAVEAANFLNSVLSLARRLEAIYLRRCNGYGTAANGWNQNDPVAKAADDAAEQNIICAIRAHFDGAGLGLILNEDPRGCALGIATPKSGRFNGMGGAADGWRLDVESMTGLRVDEGKMEPAATTQNTKIEQRKVGARIVIAREVLDVLERCTCEADRLILPAAKLSRPLYEKVDQALKAAGGKWNRSAGAHVFSEENAGEVLDSLLTSGEVVDRKKALQAFYTPAPLADRLIALADIKEGQKVYEPSAGGGALLRPLVKTGAIVFANEIDERKRDKTLSEFFGYFTGGGFSCCDFLTIEPAPNFDRIVMNPPFSAQQDVRHVMHAAKFLKPGGRLVAIMSPSAPVRTSGPGSEFLALVSDWGGRFEDVEPGAFAEAGTQIATVILILDRPEV